MLFSLKERCLQALQQREAEHRQRNLPTAPAQGIDFCSNDYLGLAKDLDIQKEVIKYWTQAPGNGATGSRLLSGNSTIIEQLEKELATFFGAEAALLFSTGYMASLALLSAVPRRGDLILYDAHIHASAKDGLRLSQAHYFNFFHNNTKILLRKARAWPQKRVFVLSEGLFSMEGDVAPLSELVACTQEIGAILMLDEAHSTGIFGPQGQGLAYAKGLTEQVPLRLHTFGKAWGAQGACIVGEQALITYLINFARPFIYSTAPPPVHIHTLRAILQRFKQEKTNLSLLQAHIHTFQKAAQQLPTTHFSPQPGPIQAFKVPGSTTCKAAAHYLQAHGYDLRPILAPTVPPGQERLRICLHSFNTASDMQGLVHCFQQYLSSLPLQT